MTNEDEANKIGTYSGFAADPIKYLFYEAVQVCCRPYPSNILSGSFYSVYHRCSQRCYSEAITYLLVQLKVLDHPIRIKKVLRGASVIAMKKNQQVDRRLVSERDRDIDRAFGRPGVLAFILIERNRTARKLQT